MLHKYEQHFQNTNKQNLDLKFKYMYLHNIFIINIFCNSYVRKLVGVWCNMSAMCYPMSCRQRSSCSMRAGCAVGTRCLMANHRFSELGSSACWRSDPRYTELNVPSPILRCTSNTLSNFGSFCRSSLIWFSGKSLRAIIVTPEFRHILT